MGVREQREREKVEVMRIQRAEGRRELNWKARVAGGAGP